MQGWPETNGIYLTRNEAGEERPLMHRVCHINGRHRWMTLQGGDVTDRIEMYRKKECKLTEISSHTKKIAHSAIQAVTR